MSMYNQGIKGNQPEFTYYSILLHTINKDHKSLQEIYSNMNDTVMVSDEVERGIQYGQAFNTGNVFKFFQMYRLERGYGKFIIDLFIDEMRKWGMKLILKAYGPKEIPVNLFIQFLGFSGFDQQVENIQGEIIVGKGPRVKTFFNPKRMSTAILHATRNLGLIRLNRDQFQQADFLMHNKYSQHFKEGQMLNWVPGVKYLDEKVKYGQSLLDYDRIYGGYNGYKSHLSNPVQYGIFFNKMGHITESEQAFLDNAKDGMYILKSSTAYGGDDIQLITDVQEFKQAIKLKGEGKKDGKFNTGKEYIIQKYIEKIALINNKKFDFRSFMYIACTDPFIVVYIPGYVRTTMRDYDLENTDLDIHIGNGIFQRDFPDYWKILRKSSYDIRKYKEVFLKQYDVKEKEFDKLIAKVKAATTYGVTAVKDKLSKNKGDISLMAQDIVIDENLNPFIVEFNLQPYSVLDNPCFEQIIPDIMGDWFDSGLSLHGFTREQIIEESQKDPKFVCNFIQRFNCEVLINDAINYNFLDDFNVQEYYGRQ
ncbi:hypothetical protein PPERSA_01353 [Pseudocohnilembus persalinus]|uniref:SAC3/GANP/THP3 conserved domain-containing protein n=1 Tax=Pseudocohnilembus persalinus TaxID=266149 RepID=A0A0V0QH39_PSEPJ|nr:hypothetical protein PPERSA_01353 [Pseudocohnilembus persalinus]|eukprot:KRX01450.1 hypothetical protein PPERSA_01353 [Pseudocohnilembus persalinus]